MVLTDTELVDMIFREESDPDLRNELLRVAANDPLVRLMPSHSVLSYLKSSMDTEVVPAPAPQIPLSPGVVLTSGSAVAALPWGYAAQSDRAG